ncbi:MAG: hypothetical protein ACRDJ9_17515 [Dehalococcoidia bacterium]
MILVDEYAALPALAGRPLPSLAHEVLALTYGRAYRLTRALLDPGPGRLQARGRFTRLVQALTTEGLHVLREILADPDPAVLRIVDPRPLIRTAGSIQNTYAVSLLQAETLAAAVTNDWPIRFAEPSSAPEPVRRAATELGLDLDTIR